MKKFLLVTDAWEPQTNGVVTTWSTLLSHLDSRGYEHRVVHAGDFRTFPLPTYRVVGSDMVAVHGIVPSIAAPGETVQLRIRPEDFYFNLATGDVPARGAPAPGVPSGSGR